MHSLVLAFSQNLVNILTSPSLTVPKVSPVTTEFSAISAGRLVLLLGKLLNQPVSKVEVVSSGPLEAHGVEHVLE